jgi:predicted alpha-1,2-mannosidase
MLRSVRLLLVPFLTLALASACGSSSNGPVDAAIPDFDAPPGTPDAASADAASADAPPGTPDAASADAAAPDAASGPTEFFTSFETGEPQPGYTDTNDTDSSGAPRSSGVTGAAQTGINGNIMEHVIQVVASGENPPGEVAASIADGDLTSKWLVFQSTGWIYVKLDQAIVVKRYAVSSANDAPERDPVAWTLEGSQDGNNWTGIDTRAGQGFGARFETHVFNFSNTTAYLYYRLNVTQNNGGGILQIAELQLSNGNDGPPPPSPMKSRLGKGPGSSWNAKLSAGFTGTHAFRFAGAVTASGRGFAFNKIFDVDVPVVATSELSYMLFADDSVDSLAYPGTYAAVDLVFDDGTYLSDLGAVDQHDATLSPSGQGASRTLYPGEWNKKVSVIGAVAAGKRVKRILVGYDNPHGPVAAFGGWIDDLRITATPSHPAPARLSDWALTTRGSNSGGGYSRGNNFPATAVPHGFNFWTPVTSADSDSWLYDYARGNNADNLPELQALSLSHEPSPWMGDRQTFQFMPSAAAGTPDASRGGRALAFRHSRETARPYYYGVSFENGIQAELTPTDHAAIFRFTFPGTSANLIFDNIDNSGGLTLDAAGQKITGFTDYRSGLSAGATRMFVYATFDKPVSASGMLGGGGGANVTGYFKFDAGADRAVTMRVATSLLSVDQAKKNLELEVAAGDSFATVKERAQKAWDDKLGVITVEGGTPDQLTTLYSNLYRLFLYPNSGFENTGTAAAPVYKYASPVSAPTSASTPTTTGARVVAGKIYVNNGFWDTYRATWPAYSLLSPGDAGAMIDGFVQQYRDGGWVSRWSSPGYANLMTGTSSDVAFADAYVKGVTGFDAAAAFDAAVRDATVLPPNGAVGRQGLETSIFKGYTSNDHGAGLSWAMAGYLNDFGIASMASALAAANPTGPRHQEYLEDAAYFSSRAQSYVNLFDPAVHFFQGKTAGGAFALSAAQYDPQVWGFDYTETDGWNTAFDAPHDGQGLANLYGSRAALGAKLDEFFATPETATFVGSYGGVIHEMREAKDVRMGQLGLSNQPSFHIPYMYTFAGQPAKTQAQVRDALARLYIGSDIGQGYIGDEDNGAMSSWYIFGALGFYPLEVGSASYVIGSPLFKKATVHLENGHTIVINAPANSAKNVYVQSLQLNGADYTKTYLTHAQLVAGATLDFVMGPTASSWGTGATDVPPSITTGTGAPQPLRDAAVGGSATSSDGSNVGALFDDTSTTRVSFTGANAAVTYHLAQPAQVTFYTVTSGDTNADPSGWTLAGSNDGTSFTTIDTRSAGAATFTWRSQTRAFKVTTPGSYAYYRLSFTGGAGTRLAEIELLK